MKLPSKSRLPSPAAKHSARSLSLSVACQEHAENLHHPLHRLFNPVAVAVVGATDRPGSVGFALMQNLQGFTGEVYPVNPSRREILQRTTHPSLTALPRVPDIAIVAVPAEAVPSVIAECAENGIPTAIIISAGFREIGLAGIALQRAVLEAAQGRVRLLGPNCLGLVIPHLGLNASFGSGMAPAGHVAFLSQSGALCTAVLDWSIHDRVGFSALVSAGGMADIDWGDLIDYFGADPRTRSIVCYMESLGDAQSFLAAARRVSVRKPIIALKAGRTAAGSQAAATHTGAMTGADDVISVAMEQSGVLRVQTIHELFDMAEVLAKQPRPAGPRLAILTNAGGPGALAADAALASGATLANLSRRDLETLEHILPPNWSHGNPVDLLGTASGRDYGHAAALLLEDPEVDGLLAILTPQAMTQADEAAVKLVHASARHSKPVLASWMGADAVSLGRGILDSAGIPTFEQPDAAARAFGMMWRQRQLIQLIHEETSRPQPPKETPESAEASAVIARARHAQRTLLSETESNQVLTAYGIPVLTTLEAGTEDEAVAAAQRIGFPVAFKLWSTILTHKQKVGGVRLNLCNADQAREAWRAIREAAVEAGGADAFHGVVVQPMFRGPALELIIGSSTDPSIGPVLLFGAGGTLAEELHDHALALPPINAARAVHWMERSRIGRALRGRPAFQSAMDRLVDLLMRFSRIVEEQPWITEIEINPLALTDSGDLLALDARVILEGPSVSAVPMASSPNSPGP